MAASWRSPSADMSSTDCTLVSCITVTLSGERETLARLYSWGRGKYEGGARRQGYYTVY